MIRAWEVDAGGGESVVIWAVQGRGGVQDARVADPCWPEAAAGPLHTIHNTDTTMLHSHECRRYHCHRQVAEG